MFPYPSAKIHIGHVRNYTIGDVVFAATNEWRVLTFLHRWDGRFLRMPAENAAIDTRYIPPHGRTKTLPIWIKAALKRMGFSYELGQGSVNLWAQLLPLGANYFSYGCMKRDWPIKNALSVNYCAKCETVSGQWTGGSRPLLAFGDEVSEKVLEQWFFKITAYMKNARILR